MKKRIYLMRHGQTLFNLHKKIQGWCDSPLTDEGIRQAGYARRYFENANIQLDHAYSSTQERASDTLELTVDMPYKRLKGLKEMNFGIYEGESEYLHQPRSRKDQHSFEREYVKFGGEANTDVVARFERTLREKMDQPDHQEALFVSHAAAIYFFTLKWFPEVIYHRDKVKFANCSILVWDYEDGKFEFVESIDHDFDEALD